MNMQEQQDKCHLAELPTEVLVCVLEWAQSAASVWRLALTCHRFYGLTLGHALWKRLYCGLPLVHSLATPHRWGHDWDLLYRARTTTAVPSVERAIGYTTYGDAERGMLHYHGHIVDGMPHGYGVMLPIHPALNPEREHDARKLSLITPYALAAFEYMDRYLERVRADARTNAKESVPQPADDNGLVSFLRTLPLSPLMGDQDAFSAYAVTWRPNAPDDPTPFACAPNEYLALLPGDYFEGVWERGTLIDGTGRFGIGPVHRHEGSVQRGMLEGPAIVLGLDPDDTYIYMGDFADDYCQGRGQYISPTLYYCGTWDLGGRAGWGECNYPSGDHYSGQMRDNMPNGWGVCTPCDEGLGRYTGYWRDGLRNGRGTLEMPTGLVYRGTWGGGLSGFAVQEANNGDRYEGQWKDGKCSGYGTMHMADGTWYRGNFDADAFDGRGTLVLADGTHWSGHWRNGYLCGFGTYSSITGDHRRDGAERPEHAGKRDRASAWTGDDDHSDGASLGAASVTESGNDVDLSLPSDTMTKRRRTDCKHDVCSAE